MCYMNVIEIERINDARVAAYTSLTEAQLRNRLHADQGLFIAESPKVIHSALDAGYEAVSLLTEQKHICGDAADVIARLDADIPIYTGERDVLTSITGYKLTRGVLCAMRRKPHCAVAEICKTARRIVVLDSITDTTNVGAIFRSAAALGIDGALLTPNTCDPLNRRAVRVSMGTVFKLPWTWLDSNDIGIVRQHGFRTVAMALRDDSVTLDDSALNAEPKLAIIMGTEGDGLSDSAISDADYVVRIPMSRGVDSLNVAAASAVAFYALT